MSTKLPLWGSNMGIPIHIRFSWLLDVYVYVRDFPIFEPLQFINGLKYRVEIWCISEAVTPLQSWQFSCILTHNLRFYENSNFLKNVCGISNFRKIWAFVLKLHTNIVHRSRTFGIKFGQNRLERFNFLRFWIF